VFITSLLCRTGSLPRPALCHGKEPELGKERVGGSGAAILVGAGWVIAQQANTKHECIDPALHEQSNRDLLVM